MTRRGGSALRRASATGRSISRPSWWRCWAGRCPVRARKTMRAGSACVPQFTSPDKAAANAYEERHILFAYVLLALIVLHVAAAAWHHFLRRDGVALRMVKGEPG